MKSRRLSSQYVLCIKNKSFPVSLEVRKIYRRIPDPEASKRGLVRIVDESGEDYLYPKDLFVSIRVPKTAQAAFSSTA